MDARQEVVLGFDYEQRLVEIRDEAEQRVDLLERWARPIGVLDHGFVRLVDVMGTDASVVQAARVSYGAGTRTMRDDESLIRYLMRNRHTSPVEMCEIKLHMKMPIFVARQLVRHRTAALNEISARYSILDSEFYLPDPKDLAVQSTNNKQGRGEELTPDQAARVLYLIRNISEQSYDAYQELLNDDGNGEPVDPDLPMLARELARMGLSLNFYTSWYWKVDLHNLLHFLGLRLHPHAQYEARVYAEAIGKIVQDWTPMTWRAFEDYRLHGASMSRMELGVMRQLAASFGTNVLDLAAQHLKGRELAEFKSKLGL